MKVLIFNTLYYPYQIGGAERSVQLLAESLNNGGDEVTVVTLHDGNKIEEINHNGVNVIKFPLANFYWPWGYSKNGIIKLLWHIHDIYNVKMEKVVAEFLKNKNFDVVHTNNLCGFSVSAWHWATKQGFPIVHTARDYYLLNPNAKLFRKGKNHSPRTIDSLLFSLIKKKAACKVTQFVGISQYIKDLHVKNKFFENDISSVIYNSIAVQESSAQRNRVYRYDNKIVLGYLGRIEDNKGIEILLKSLEKAEDGIFNLLVAGKGDEKYISFLQGRYSKVNFEFVGTVNITDFFPDIDYLIVPSLWHEPFGRVVVEANSFGIPVIASNRGGIPEIIIENKTGFVFNADNENSLVELLHEIVKLDYKGYAAMSESSFVFSRDFKSEKVMHEYKEIYNNAIKVNGNTNF
ncbi:Spore coat protein SA [Serratia proteamaculans]|uniref:glycosyltransferase family 4 protein n=1 Tax=Serratia proteamaculans TaxID=28151 RepID=UPI002179A3E3|nr:glycosyltransferase family 4 protein [Serratia proteamaculans]CAI0779702.1 Spore coat protein SA [Serratia proteamaculans]CAI1568789.1 Spore coat protein SA [Serratia proteamaculans]